MGSVYVNVTVCPAPITGEVTTTIDEPTTVTLETVTAVPLIVTTIDDVAGAGVANASLYVRTREPEVFTAPDTNVGEV